MNYIVYLTKGNNKIYLGVHSQLSEEFDGYLGEGIYVNQAGTFKYPKTPLLYAVKNHGVGKFERITLYTYKDKLKAYSKLELLLDNDFINLENTYNFCKNINRTIYQFDVNGTLLHLWKGEELTDFYGYPIQRFIFAAEHKDTFLNSLWSFKERIDPLEYSISNTQPVYLYNKKLRHIFYNEESCAEFLKVSKKEVSDAIKNKSQLCKYYISHTLRDEYVPKPRESCLHKTIYVYDKECTFLGAFKGKEIMKFINLHSWTKIYNALNGWYKNYFLSEKEISSLPERKKIKVDVYTKYGKFIETLNSLSEAREKYSIPSSKLKNIQKGDKYYNDLIFKYSK